LEKTLGKHARILKKLLQKGWKIREIAERRIYLEKEFKINNTSIIVRAFKERGVKGLILQSFSLYPVSSLLLRDFLERLEEVEWDYTFQENVGYLSFWVKDPYKYTFSSPSELEEYLLDLVKAVIYSEIIHTMNLKTLEKLLHEKGWLTYVSDNYLQIGRMLEKGGNLIVIEISISSFNSNVHIRGIVRAYSLNKTLREKLMENLSREHVITLRSASEISYEETCSILEVEESLERTLSALEKALEEACEFERKGEK